MSVFSKLFPDSIRRFGWTKKHVLATIALVTAYGVYKTVPRMLKQRRTRERRKGDNRSAKFRAQVIELLKHMIPGVISREALLLLLLSSSLVMRTFLSLYVATLDGALARSIVQTDGRQFILRLGYWLLVAVPATFVNSAIRFLESHMALAMRTRLVHYLYSLYLDGQVYYTMGVLDSRLDDVDQRLTDDVSAFTTQLCHIYSSVTKPILDIVAITITLVSLAKSKQAGYKLPMMVAVLAMTSTWALLRAVAPQFGELVSKEAQLRGQLRSAHSRVKANAEEVAFCRVNKAERRLLESRFAALSEQLHRLFATRLWFIMFEQFLMKYLWSAAGLIMVAVPVLTSPEPEGGISERTEALTIARNMLLSGSDAMERLLASLKEFKELTGLTSRVHRLLEVLRDVQQGRFQPSRPLPSTRGKLSIMDERIELHKVPVITPEGQQLLDGLEFKLEPGMHLLITGPNGSGKSSIFRVLAGLWPLFGGELTRPDPEKLLYLPQRPYLCVGSLRDQLIYPDSEEELHAKGTTDSDLHQLLSRVGLDNLAARGWDDVKDWREALSGGEQQRLGMARLFYHRPRFAMLDECTSAMAVDGEQELYEAALGTETTLLSIAHRPALRRFHTHELAMDGSGGWTLNVLTNAES